MSDVISILLIDPVPKDRAAILSVLGDRVGEVIEAATAAEAWEKVTDRRRLTMMIAGVDAGTGEEILDLRDHLHIEIGLFPSMICSRDDMTAFYPRVLEIDRLFFKPVNRGVLLEWFEAASQIDVAAVIESGSVDAGPVSAPPPEIETAPSHEPAETPVQPHETSSVQLPEEALPVGTRLGDYKLLREIQQDADFALFEAEQTSIGRKVALKTLYRKHRKDIRWVQGFVNEASARASVNHPAISLVYECDQEMGVNFYTLELVDAPSLADLARRRSELDESVIWKIVEACSSALVYLRESGMSHRLISAQSILMLRSGQARIANPVRGRGAGLTVEQEREQMESLADAIAPFLKKSGGDPQLHLLVERLGSDRIDAVNSIDGLSRVLSPSTPEDDLTGAEIAKLNEQKTDRTAIVVGTAFGVLMLAGFAAAYFFLGSKPEVRDLSGMSKIPEGVFPYQDGEETEVSEFWIGQYEVTISDYAAFLEDISLNPGKIRKIRHPEQPESKVTFKPEKWDEIYEKAVKGGKFYGGEIDPNSPVTGVDWWDAYAYAKWRGGRLPTEQEWEKAARGRAGSIFPWGDEMVNSNFNSGLDHEAGGAVEGGQIDGYRFWSPVDAILADESRYGVIGLAGNVSEWTGTWDSHPDSPDKQVPIKRGASFATKSGFELTARRAGESADERNFWTGFRIASDRATPRIIGGASPGNKGGE
ncbi:MAG: SUMF1/EgtB/PvdO family nonheme iron enzyme [Verrucomicrobiales bacterium]|nr:SUMF1/EgtB/PvdO family nonheme iron enzyme [Verrucomicrobiales bacterium]